MCASELLQPRLRYLLLLPAWAAVSLLCCLAAMAQLPADDPDSAFAALRAKRCVEASDLFDGILKLHPDNVDARYGRGLSRLCLGEYDTAAEDLQSAAVRWPERRDVALELGSALTSAGAYAEAKEWLLRAQEDAAYDGPASLLLGLGQLRLGNLDAALIQFERARAKSAALETQSRYYAGVAEFRAGRIAPAKEHFAAVEAAAPSTALGHEASAFLKEIQTRRRDQYAFFGGLGFEYDSNVVLAPLQDLSGGGQQSDGRFILRAGVVGTPLQTHNLRVDLGYSFFQSLHFELGDFNLQTHEPRLDINATTPWGWIGVDSRFDYFLRSERLYRFLQQWSVRPFTVVPFGQWGETEIYYRYRGRNYVEDQFEQVGLDSTANAAGVRHAVSFAGDRGRVALGYQFENDNLQNTPPTENQFTYDANAGIAELDWKLPYEINSTLNYGIIGRVYSDGSRPPGGGARRHDDNHSVSLTLRRPLTPQMELLVGYLGIFNDSNQSLYEYQRHVAILALSIDY